MAKRLLALLLTLAMVLQPVLPAAAEAVGEDIEVTEATEETVEVTEEVTEEATEEPTEEVSTDANETKPLSFLGADYEDESLVYHYNVAASAGDTVALHPAANVDEDGDIAYQWMWFDPVQEEYVELFAEEGITEQSPELRILVQEHDFENTLYMCKAEIGHSIATAIFHFVKREEANDVYSEIATYEYASYTLEVGKTKQLSVSQRSPVPGSQSWRSSNSTVVKIESSGTLSCNIRAITTGTANITCNYAYLLAGTSFRTTDTFKITVTPSTTPHLRLSTYSLSLKTGQSSTIGVEVENTILAGAYGPSFVSIVQVANGFRVTGIAPGSGDIEITAGSLATTGVITKTCHIEVTGLAISGKCGTGLSWQVQDDSILTISGKGEMNDYTASTVPWKGRNDSIKKVIVESGVTSIGDYAFSDFGKLETVTLPESLKHIGKDAFSACGQLGNVYYHGHKNQWDAIQAEDGNNSLTKAILHPEINIIYIGVPEKVKNPNPSKNFCGEELQLQSLSRTGYIFDGWYKENNLKTKVGSIPADNTQDVTLYAKWTAIHYTLSFNLNGGTGTIPDMQLEYDETGTLPSEGFSFTGSVATKWTTSKGGSGKSYSLGQQVSNLSSKDGATIVLYAQWRPITYQISFESNGGTGTPENRKVSYGESFRLPDAKTVTRDLYSLSGWTVVIDGIRKNYQPGDEIKITSDADGATVMFRAQWVPDFGTVSSIKWSLDKNGLLTISGTGKMPDFSSAQSTPWDKNRIRSLEIGNEITYIGMNAFSGCAELVEVEISTSVELIGSKAFSMCTKLAQVSMYSGVTSIGESAFQGCSSLEIVTLPDTLEKIGRSAFADCGSTISYLYAGSLAQWGTVTYDSADDPLTNGYVQYRNGSKYSYMNGRSGSTASWKLLPDGTLRILGSGEVIAPANISGEAYWTAGDVKYAIVDVGITKIGGSVFKDCTALVGISLPVSLMTIGDDAFIGCTGLKSVRYSGKQEQWDAITIASGNEVLANAKLLLSTYMLSYKNADGATNPNPDTADKDNALTLKDATRTGYLFGGWYKEDSFTTKVTTIPADNEADVTLYAKWTPINYSVSFDANGGVGSAEKITLKYGEMAEVPGSGFSRTGYTFSGWNTQIDGRGTAYAFGQTVTNLSSTQGTNVVLYAQWTANSYQVKFDLNGGEGKLDGWKATYDKPFKLPDENSATRENYSLIGWITVIDGKNVTYTPGQEVKNLASEDGTVITFIAQWGKSGTFGTLTWKLTDDGTLTIGGSGEMDSLGYPWEDYASTVRRLEVQSGVTSIAKSAFSGFEALEEVVLADTVTIIDGSAFSMCGKLSKLDLGSGLRVIYSHAFEFCDSLEEVNLPASASSISPSAFENCGSLQNFHVASGNETYCDAEGVLFWNGKVLLAAFPGGRTGSYTVPGSVKTIGDCAFYASKLTEVVLPSGLKAMGDYCFRYSTISQLTLPAGLENLGVGAFEGCKKLKTVTVPGSVKTVPESAFFGSGLETVELEDGITAIETEAFLSCAITKITIPSSVTSIGEHALGYEANRMNYDKIAGFTIIGLEGSAAQKYADSNGFQFEKIPMAILPDIPDTVTAGASIQLKAQVIPAQYDTGKYIWSLKNEADSAYVTLSGNKLTAKPVPEVLHVTVVCTNGSLRAERTITIVPTLAGITVYHEEEPVSGSLSVDLNETDTVILTARAMPESAAMEPKWSWSDTKGAFGTYSQENGALTVNLDRYAKLGTITLTVTDQLTKKKTAVKLITTRKSFGDIVILGAPGTMTGGSSLKLEALFSGSPANTKVLWSLDDEDQAYASITSTGKLTATQVTEEHTITVHAQAADGGSSGTSQITLVPKVQTLGLLLDGEAVEKSATIYLNDAQDFCLAANTWPEDASENVTWTVSKNKIATAQTRSDGTLYLSRFTGETGTVTVKATAQDGSKKTVSLQLKFARRPDSVTILDSKGKKIEEPISLKGKQSYSFKTEIRTEYGEKLTDKDLVWYVNSDDEGYVTLKNGKVSVRSFASNEPVSVFIEVRVKSHPETKDRVELKLLPDQASGIYIDAAHDRERLNDTVYTVDRSAVMLHLRAKVVGLPDNSVVWSLGKPTDVVTIEADGTVWLKKAGTVTVTAINPASKQKASFKLVVTENVRKLTVSNAPSLLSGGKKATLKAETIPAKPTNSKLTWFLVDNGGGAASITAAGALTAAKVTGVHTVKVAVKTQDGIVVSEPVEIRIVPAASRVAISGMPHNNTVDLNTCSSLKLTARVYPSVSSQKVNWSSSNKSVLVDENGNVTILSGAKPGSVTLTATAADGSGKKATAKLSLVRCVTSISMVNSAVVTGGKSLKLSAAVDKPATNKKLVWSMTGDTVYCTLSGGTLKTKAVTTVKHVTVQATAADGSGVYAKCDVTILPK